MAFPSVLSVTRTTANRNSTQTTHTVDLPACSAGDKMVLIFSNGLTTDPSDGGDLADWTRLGTGLCDIGGTDGDNRTTAWEKVFASGQSATTIDVTTPSSVASDAQVYLIDAGTFDSNTAGEAAGDGDAGGGTDPDPPNLNPANWDAEDTLWIACGCGRDFGNSAWTAPTNYGNLEGGEETTTGSEVHLWTARRELNASSENPGVFGSPFEEWWSSLTVAIRPSSGGTPATVTPAVIATTAAVPTPAASGAAAVSPAAVATTTAVPGPSAEGQAAVAPGEVASDSTLPTPATTVGKTVTPSAVVTLAALPTPTPAGEAEVSVAVVATTSTLPTPSAGAAVDVQPAAVVTTVTLPTPAATAAKTVTPGVVATVVAMSAPTPVGGTVVSPDVVETLVDILLPLTGVPEVDVAALTYYQFHRKDGNLVLAPVGRSARRGFRTSEGFERVSDVVRMDQTAGAEASPKRAMQVVASAWSANSGASEATLKAALHAALQTAGFRGQGGVDLT